MLLLSLGYNTADIQQYVTHLQRRILIPVSNVLMEINGFSPDGTGCRFDARHKPQRQFRRDVYFGYMAYYWYIPDNTNVRRQRISPTYLPTLLPHGWEDSQ